MIIRRAVASEADAIARLVNDAYEVERFFVEGDRTSGDEVRSLMAEGAFLAAVDPATLQIAGSIYVNVTERLGYFGMLAVTAAAQGHWLGLRLIQAAERHSRKEGALAIDIEVVNLRSELFPYYHRLGYVETGETRPYVHRPVTRTCHFVVLRKRLAGPG